MSTKPFIPRFRFWNSVRNEWENPQMFEVNSDGQLFHLYGGDADCIVERGLNRKDSLGNSLYEGDIVDVQREDRGMNRYVICFGPIERTMDTGMHVEIVGFYFNPPFVKNDGFFAILKNWKGGSDYDLMTRLGNIHENPELLKN